MKIVIIDGQGGKMGKSVIEQLKNVFQAGDICHRNKQHSHIRHASKQAPPMAPPENLVIKPMHRTSSAPIGIVMANSLWEITPAMATAIGISSDIRY